MAMYADAIPRLIRQRWTISAYSLGLQPQQNLDQASLSSRFAEPLLRATRRVLIEHQQRRQLPPRFDQIGERVRI